MPNNTTAERPLTADIPLPDLTPAQLRDIPFIERGQLLATLPETHPVFLCRRLRHQRAAEIDHQHRRRQIEQTLATLRGLLHTHHA